MRKYSLYLAFVFLAVFGFVGIADLAHAEILWNPLKASTVHGLVCLVVNFLVQKLMPPIAVLMVLYASFLLLTAGGNPGRVQSARQILIYTIVGAGILLLAPAIVALVVSVAGAPPSDPSNEIPLAEAIKLSGDPACNVATAGMTVLQALANIVNWFSWLLAILSVAVGLYAGFLYMTAAGEAQKVSIANHVLVYAIVGVAVAILAFSVISILEGFIL
ncbi:MAG: hypothetical protein AAB581_00790 [Patescibacteria group bacterium]